MRTACICNHGNTYVHQPVSAGVFPDVGLPSFNSVYFSRSLIKLTETSGLARVQRVTIKVRSDTVYLFKTVVSNPSITILQVL